MIYWLIALMTLLVIAYIVAWIAVPSLRNFLESPTHTLLENSDRFKEEHLS